MSDVLTVANAKRFWSRVQKSNDCWLWQAGQQSEGYGVLWIGRVPILAHRFSWFLANGMTPSSVCVLHSCDVRSCVRPSHLFLGDRTVNAADMDAKGRRRGFVLLKGESHGSAKLTEIAVLSIRASTESAESLARTHCVSRPTIINIRARRTWRHI